MIVMPACGFKRHHIFLHWEDYRIKARQPITATLKHKIAKQVVHLSATNIFTYAFTKLQSFLCKTTKLRAVY